VEVLQTAELCEFDLDLGLFDLLYEVASFLDLFNLRSVPGGTRDSEFVLKATSGFIRFGYRSSDSLLGGLRGCNDGDLLGASGGESC